MQEGLSASPAIPCMLSVRNTALTRQGSAGSLLVPEPVTVFSGYHTPRRVLDKESWGCHSTGYRLSGNKATPAPTVGSDT